MNSVTGISGKLVVSVARNRMSGRQGCLSFSFSEPLPLLVEQIHRRVAGCTVNWKLRMSVLIPIQEPLLDDRWSEPVQFGQSNGSTDDEN